MFGNHKFDWAGQNMVFSLRSRSRRHYRQLRGEKGKMLPKKIFIQALPHLCLPTRGLWIDYWQVYITMQYDGCRLWNRIWGPVNLCPKLTLKVVLPNFNIKFGVPAIGFRHRHFRNCQSLLPILSVHRSENSLPKDCRNTPCPLSPLSAYRVTPKSPSQNSALETDEKGTFSPLEIWSADHMKTFQPTFRFWPLKIGRFWFCRRRLTGSTPYTIFA